MPWPTEVVGAVRRSVCLSVCQASLITGRLPITPRPLFIMRHPRPRQGGTTVMVRAGATGTAAMIGAGVMMTERFDP